LVVSCLNVDNSIFIFVFSDSNINSSLNYTSKYHPYSNINRTVVVRFAATPVYGVNDTSVNAPDGVLVCGDIVNGKAGVNDLVLESYGSGNIAVSH
jgi:hypothetical protein